MAWAGWPVKPQRLVDQSGSQVQLAMERIVYRRVLFDQAPRLA